VNVTVKALQDLLDSLPPQPVFLVALEDYERLQPHLEAAGVLYGWSPFVRPGNMLRVTDSSPKL
jgi:hypothetical protein